MLTRIISNSQISPPKVIGGRYLLLEEIGKGKFGSVHKAADIIGGNEVAVKIGKKADDYSEKVLLNEAEALGRISHGGVVGLIEFGRSESGPFLSMEYIKGQNMLQHIAGEHITARKGLGMMSQVCSALEALHSAGVVHRDLKPKNIMVRMDGEIALIDFGFSLASRTDDITKDFSFRFGSPVYSPPEDTRNNPDPRTDIYSAGVMLIELVMERSKYRIFNMLKLFDYERRPSSIIEKLGGDAAGREIARIAVKATSKEPDQRFQSAIEMRERIDWVLKYL